MWTQMPLTLYATTWSAGPTQASPARITIQTSARAQAPGNADPALDRSRRRGNCHRPGRIVGTWTVRHAWAIYKLNRGVGDTVFYDADGRPWFRLDEQRQDVPSDQISTYFKDAVIAVEDHRFYLHPGIDPIGLTRAVVLQPQADSTQGGSTITQQLARTLFLPTSRPTDARPRKRCWR